MQQSQAYNLYLKETTVSYDHLKMLASGEYSLLKIDFLHTRNLQYYNFKMRFFQTTQYEDISRAANLEKSMEINHIFLHSHRQDFEYLI